MDHIKEEEYSRSPVLDQGVSPDNTLKNFLVNHVGDKAKPDDNNVTVEMIVETMAKEFPEFLMVVAEENWVRGYHQALSDVEIGRKIAEEREENNVKQKSCKLCEE